MAEWAWRDGQRLTPAMAADFDALNTEFHRITGCWLRVSSGLRTDQEQIDIFLSRYVPSWQVNGRRVYDYRWWNGVLYARISSAGTVAAPGTSNHQINMAAGRYGALDVYDTGSDAGVLTRGSWRANVFDQIAWRYGYDSEGYAFGENWHKRYNRNPWRPIAAPAGDEKPAPAPEPEPEPEDEDDDMWKPTVHIRTEGPFEATLAHPEIGLDLDQHTGPGTGGKRLTGDGKATVYRGFMVTADKTLATAWARMYTKGSGLETSRTDRAGYIAIQVEASRVSAEITG